jgi:competence protein ComEA
MPRAALIAVAIVAVAAAGLGFARLHVSGGQAVAIIEHTPVPTRTPESILVIDVTGAVAQPGVYRLPQGSRVVDALLAAGGMTAEADLFALNKAAPVRDGQRIYVPRPGETVAATDPAGDARLKLDLNHASAGELEALPGIGPATASRIVRSRNARPFVKTEELQTRGLVSARVFTDIRDLITTR